MKEYINKLVSDRVNGEDEMKIRKANAKDLKEITELYLEYQKEEEKLSELYKERW